MSQTKDSTLEEKKQLSVEEKVEEVNKILKKGEPVNINVDPFTKYVGYKPQYVVDAMNTTFGIGNWGFEEIQTEMINTVETERVLPTLATCQVKVFIKEIEFMPVGWGQSRVTRGDVGDAKKGAQTDALKKALSYFSVGNRAYHGLLKNGQETETPTETNSESQEGVSSETPKTLGNKVLCKKCGRFYHDPRWEMCWDCKMRKPIPQEGD